MEIFTATPDFVYDEEITYQNLVTQFENGTEQRRQKWATPKRKFTLSFVNRTLAEMQVVRAFFVARTGTYDSFLFTNPNDSVQYTVRFAEDSFKYSNTAYQIYEFEVTLYTPS